MQYGISEFESISLTKNIQCRLALSVFASLYFLFVHTRPFVIPHACSAEVSPTLSFISSILLDDYKPYSYSRRLLMTPAVLFTSN